jgi:cardiolipin synthase
MLFGAALVLVAILTLLFVNFTREKEIRNPVVSPYAINDPQFRRSMGNLLGPPLVEGNRVETLVNGDRIFPAMLEAIRSAKKTITFETYIYWSGDIGKAFADALAERAKAGVKVHILLDWVGSQKIKEEYLQEMNDAGAEIRKYHPPRWYNINRLNNRRTGRSSSWTGASASPAASGSRITGAGTRRTRITGAIRITAWRAPRRADAGGLRR